MNNKNDIFVSNDVILDADLGVIYIIDQGVVIKVVADEYSPSKTYSVGDYVINIDTLYKCIVAVTEPEEFDSNKWQVTKVVNELEGISDEIASLDDRKADKSSVYTKAEIDTTVNGIRTDISALETNKADKSSVYTKEAIQGIVNSIDDDISDLANTVGTKADKSYVDDNLNLKADKATTYTKTDVDNALALKADDSAVYKKDETYTKEEVNRKIDNLPAPMIYKGTLGVNGTITTLPTASAENEGFTYKVITDGTYAGISAKVGDSFTSNGSEWVIFPSGDETFTDTWRGIKVNGTEKLGSAISSGEVDFIDGTNTTVTFNPTGNKIKVDVDGYTQAQVDSKLSLKANTADVYNKSAVDSALALKANNADVYNKTTADEKYALKADKATTYTKTEVDEKFEDIEPIKTASGAIASFETNISDNVVELTAEINPVQSGSGTPSPSNPRPISGFTECNIVDCGVNLWDEETELGQYNMTTGLPQPNNYCIRGINRFSVLPNTIYYGVNNNVRRLYYDENDNFISGDYGQGPKITPANARYMRIYLSDSYGTDYNNDVSINYSATDTDYHPYNGNLVTVAFGQTVYGGVLTCKNGAWKFTGTKGAADLTDMEQSTIGGQTVFIKSISNAKLPSSDSSIAEIVAEAYEPIRYYGIAGTPNTIALSTASLLAVNTGGATPPVGKCMFTLATPIEIDLTAEQVATLVGLNNVFHDANGEIEVEYLTGSAGDIKKVIETTKFADLSDIPNPPSTDGTYRLKVTIADGKATYSWELIE